MTPETVTRVDEETSSAVEEAEATVLDHRARLAIIGLHEVVIADRGRSHGRYSKPAAINTLSKHFPRQRIPDGFGELHELPSF
jgi:hypothetical protein